jgi:hypothetical protein
MRMSSITASDATHVARPYPEGSLAEDSMARDEATQTRPVANLASDDISVWRDISLGAESPSTGGEGRLVLRCFFYQPRVVPLVCQRDRVA